MFCAFCGKEIRGGAQFCAQCGKNQVTGLTKYKAFPAANLLQNKKAVIAVALAAVAIIVIMVCATSGDSKDIVGVWMDGTSRIIFTADGSFRKSDATMGTYTIREDNTLVLNAGDFSYWSGQWEYEYSKKAIDEDYEWPRDDGYWYIQGDTLYLHGREYKRVE